MTHKISVTANRKGLNNPTLAAKLRKAVKTALQCEGVTQPCEVNIMLTDDAGIHEINLAMRQVDRPTDVLSFPLNELTPGAFDPALCERDMDTGALMLGDMMICVPRCEEQGQEFGHGYEREIMYLTVHSVLHLLGYDHVDEGEQKKAMREREKVILKGVGYIS